MRTALCFFALLSGIILLFAATDTKAQERPTMILPPSSGGGLFRPSRPPVAAPAAPAPQRPAARPHNTAPRPIIAAPTTPLSRPPVPAAYETPMLELSESIGALAFLTHLCSPTTQPNPWIARMEGLLASEGESAGNREKLIGAYNQGYLAFSTSYRQCTDAAKAARGLLVRDAIRLARDIERKFGA